MVQRDWSDDLLEEAQDTVSSATDTVSSAASSAYDTASSAYDTVAGAVDATTSAAAGVVADVGDMDLGSALTDTGRALGPLAGPVVGSQQAGGVPDQQLGDTPGSRTPDETPGVKESENKSAIGLMNCITDQAIDIAVTDLPVPGLDTTTSDYAMAIAKKFGICVVAKCLPSSLVVSILESMYFAGQPQAVANLDHYIEGSGAPFPQPMDRFLKDQGVHDDLSSKMAEAPRSLGDRVVLANPLNQLSYRSEEWRNALGNIDEMTVTVLGDPASKAFDEAANGSVQVQVELRDPYQWHPREPRITQCLRELFEAMKKDGAAEYDAVGTGTTILDFPVQGLTPVLNPAIP